MIRSAIAALALASAWAVPAHASLSLLQFQGNGYFAKQASGGDTITGQVSWNPTLEAGALTLRGNLGVGLLKGSFDDKFLSFNYQALANFNLLAHWAVEAGGGMQTWVDNGGTHPIASGNLVYEKPGFINRVFAGYSRFFMSNATDEFRLGIGIAL